MRRLLRREQALELALGGLFSAAVLLMLTTADARAVYPTFCPVHETSMHAGIVPVRYGMLTLGAIGTGSAFRNANLTHPGGCVVSYRFLALVNYCERCREVVREVPPRDA